MAIVDIANVMSNAEGWNKPGSLAQRNNNPGNLVYIGPTMLGEPATLGEGGFAKFNSPDAGMTALQNQISLDASRGMTVQQFISKYDNIPQEQQNYLDIFQSQLGANPNDSLSALISGAGVVDASTNPVGTNNNISDVIGNIDPTVLGVISIFGVGLLLLK